MNDKTAMLTRIMQTVRPEVQAMRAYPVTPPWTGIKIELMEDNHLDSPQSAPALRDRKSVV